MRLNVISIGNSRGIRIPKAVIDQCGIDKSVTLEVESDRLILRPVKLAREGWDEAFEKMARNNDDVPLDTPATEFDHDEWTW